MKIKLRTADLVKERFILFISNEENKTLFECIELDTY